MLWITGWLKTIILVILLATVIDLLLPNKAMQNYVRTVMGLFILLTLMTPLFDLFHRKWNAEKLLSMAETEQTAIAGLPSGASLDAIAKDAGQLAAAGRKQSQAMVEKQIASQVKDQIEKESALQVKEVKVRTEVDAKGQAVIGLLAVRLQPGSPDTGGKTSAKASAVEIEPVKPVTIGLEKSESPVKEAAQRNSSLRGSGKSRRYSNLCCRGGS